MCRVTEPVRMSEKAALRVVVTGAAGQIAYSLLYQIASGYVFGEDQVTTTLWSDCLLAPLPDCQRLCLWRGPGIVGHS